ncbi:hypothetical protein TRFO_07071 [Tritrichomonas foetus]|uniref:Uncharacterized protein n=1 Tax=Tritrichomonas foetus TaxID=1144522 RepID=A0A1J4JU23_9EUKA|nr:hypothetical protein TRFO_07071 [Tritrichomonas foetus]|eukprot:OHT02639.1 hypothetical protein TRFO_07071 [Tritrichomonas foetus]
MIAQIKTIKDAILQIDIIRQKIAEIKAAAAHNETAYKDEMMRTQEKVTALTEQLRREDDPNRQKTRDEKKLMRIQLTLQELVATTVQQDDTIAELEERLNHINSKISKISKNIQKVEKENKHNAKLLKKIGSFSSVTMKVTELESRLNLLCRQKKKSTKRINTQNLSALNIQKSNEALEKQLNSEEDTFQSLVASINSIEPDDKKSQEDLANLVDQVTCLNNDVENAEKEFSEEKENNEKIISGKNNEKNDLHLKLNDTEQKVVEVTQNIDQYSIEHTILVNKKKTLIDQLKRSIKDKVNDITRSRNSSPYVLRLIESQEKHWVERQQLFEVYNVVARKHKKMTDTVARKAIILDELREWMKNVPRSDLHEPLTELEIAYQTAVQENREHASSIAALTRELELVTKENQELNSYV